MPRGNTGSVGNEGKTGIAGGIGTGNESDGMGGNAQREAIHGLTFTLADFAASQRAVLPPEPTTGAPVGPMPLG